MNMKMSEENSVVLCTWEFDNYGSTYKNWIDYSNTNYGQSILLYQDTDLNKVNKDPSLSIYADFDQWGVWITFKIGESSFIIAQEAETRSFLDALIASLTKLKDMTDMNCQPSTIIKKEV